MTAVAASTEAAETEAACGMPAVLAILAVRLTL